MSLRSTLLKVVLPIIILAVGLAGMKVLVASRRPPAKAPRENPGVLVEVMTVTTDDVHVTVHGTGTVKPRREAKIIPQVSGRVVSVSPSLVPGGFFKKGEPLFEIESQDYRLALERAKAALAQARYNLVTVETQARVARIEWERLSNGLREEATPLVLYEPQLDNARAAVGAAAAGLEQAELDLARTKVSAPFDCLVRSKNIDVGQAVSPNGSVVEVVGTEVAEIIVPLSLEDLSWITVPGPGGPPEGSETEVFPEHGDVSWPGRVVRSLGEVDPVGRMARVAVAVADPYGLDGGSRGVGLQFGMFVRVAIQGRHVSGVVSLPRSALRDGGNVWIVDEDDLLRIRPVRVLRKEKESVLVAEGLNEGERVVLTPLTGAVDGMKLRPRPQEEKAP